MVRRTRNAQARPLMGPLGWTAIAGLFTTIGLTIFAVVKCENLQDAIESRDDYKDKYNTAAQKLAACAEKDQVVDSLSVANDWLADSLISTRAALDSCLNCRTTKKAPARKPTPSRPPVVPAPTPVPVSEPAPVIINNTIIINNTVSTPNIDTVRRQIIGPIIMTPICR